MAPNVEIVHDEKLILGEGPHWDHEAQALYYVDIVGSIVFKYVPSTKAITRVFVDRKEKLPVGFVVPVAGAKDKFLIGYGKKLAVLTWDGVSTDPSGIEILVDVDSAGNDVRFNDGKADPQGRLWAGTMSEHATPDPELKLGTLYSLNPHQKSAKAHVTDVGISNGLAWTSDNKTFYYVDSFTYAIDGFDYDITSGELRNRRTIFDTRKSGVMGLPDGMTIDVDDKLWLATFGGSAVHKIDPRTGALLQLIKLPASKVQRNHIVLRSNKCMPMNFSGNTTIEGCWQITSVAWGGPNLDELYVTSASVSETEDNNYSGRLFKIAGLGTSGLPGVPVKL